MAKLSKLQKTILALAAEAREQRHGNGVDVYYSQILAEAFGFPHKCDRYPHVPCRWVGGQHFSRTEIGERRYDAAAASVSRAVRRLEQRGLVTVYVGRSCRWSGVALTDEAVKTEEKFPES